MTYAFYCRLGVHVYASDREVIRAIRSRLAGTAFERDKRTERHALYRAVLEEHSKARRLCREFRL